MLVYHYCLTVITVFVRVCVLYVLCVIMAAGLRICQAVHASMFIPVYANQSWS